MITIKEKNINKINRPLNRNEIKYFVKRKVISEDKKELWKENVPVYDLLDEISDIKKIHTNSLIKIRLFEGNRKRVRDFSFINLVNETDTDNNRLWFKFRFKGDPENWVYFDLDLECNIILNHPRGLILVYVNGPIYYKDGTRRYED